MVPGPTRRRLLRKSLQCFQTRAAGRLWRRNLRLVVIFFLIPFFLHFYECWVLWIRFILIWFRIRQGPKKIQTFFLNFFNRIQKCKSINATNDNWLKLWFFFILFMYIYLLNKKVFFLIWHSFNFVRFLFRSTTLNCTLVC